MTEEEGGTASSDRWAATNSAARAGSARRSCSSNPSSVMPRSRSCRAVSGVTQTWAGRLSGNRPRLTVWATPRMGNGRPWIVTVPPARARRVAASPPSSTTPPPGPSQRPLVTSGWSTGEGPGSRTSAVRSSVPPAIRIEPYRWVQGPPAATTPGALASRSARRRRLATRARSPGSSGGW
jgi:hypothetical protein